MKTIFTSEDSKRLGNGKFKRLEELCPYANEECELDIEDRCKDSYEKCIIYLRYKVIDKFKPMTGLQRFQMRYKDFDYGKQLGIGS